MDPGFVCVLKYHQQCADTDQDATNDRFWREFFVEEHGGQHQSDDNAQFVNGHDLGRFAQLQSLIIT